MQSFNKKQYKYTTNISQYIEICVLNIIKH